MFTRMSSVAVTVAGVLLFSAPGYAADDASAGWECKKGNTAVVVSGDTAAAKQADCEKQGGKWVKKQAAGSTKGW